MACEREVSSSRNQKAQAGVIRGLEKYKGKGELNVSFCPEAVYYKGK